MACNRVLLRVNTRLQVLECSLLAKDEHGQNALGIKMGCTLSLHTREVSKSLFKTRIYFFIYKEEKVHTLWFCYPKKF